MRHGKRAGAPGLQHRLWRPAIWLLVLGLLLSGLVLFGPTGAYLPEVWALTWRHATAVIHGLLAGWSILMLGALLARHALPMWRVQRVRWSGVLVLFVWGALALSGQFSQYGADGATRDWVVAMHGWLGVAFLLPVLLHTLGRKAAASVQ